MSKVYHHDYLFSVTDKDIRKVLYDIGIARDHCFPGTEEAPITHESPYAFLDYAGLIQKESYALSETGKNLFELLFVFSDEIAAEDQIAQILLKNPVVNLLCQSFYGRGKVSVEQLRILFNYHGVGSEEVDYSGTVSLLSLLNKYGIVVYDKKNKAFTVKRTGDFAEPVKQYYVCPDTPYSNIYNMRKVIRACRGEVYWVDKHFRKEGFEILIDGLPFEGVTSITIISGTDNVTTSAKADFHALQAELSNRSIDLQWRIVTDSTFKWHDRWLVADNQCHNIPPVLAIIRGQRSEILETSDPLDVNSFMVASTPIE